MKLYLLGVLLAVSYGWVSAGNYRVGSYDLGDLDMDKVNNPDVLHVITKVVRRYDILLLQGVKYPNVVDRIKEEVNSDEYWVGNWSTTGLGKNGDEYFIFIFNHHTTSLNEAVVYETEDLEYHPVAARFTQNSVYNGQLFIGVAKLDEDQAYDELSMLPDALRSAQSYFGYEYEEIDWLLMGRLNADSRCSSISSDELEQFIADNAYDTWVGDGEDGLVDDKEECSPNNIFSVGSQLQYSIIYGSVDTLDNLDRNKVMATSEYYPVYIEMYSREVSAGSTLTGVSFWIMFLALILAF